MLTFLFTDLENSTPLWESFPAAMQQASARHDALLRAAIVAHNGRVIKSTGDGFHAVFASPADGVMGALAGQLALLAESWPAETGPLLVRMGLHTGESRERDGDYFGLAVNRAARIMDCGHGGQVLLSAATAALIRPALPAELTLLDLGDHRLRGLGLPERIWQLCYPGLPAEFPPLRALSAYRHNLPSQLSSFVGREQELADIRRLLGETRLLTLLGPGGTGKTRLMLESAESVLGDYEHGVWLVELAPLTDPERVAERVAAALNAQEQAGRPMRDALVDYLRRKQLLLLLDNVEHLVRECAELAAYLLSRCPDLKMMVTGREALFIAGEVTLQVPSLSLPGSGGGLAAIAACESVQLFLARAQEIRPDFELGAENAPLVAEIVRRLDGIPLALELATARLRMLTVDQIAQRLSDRFRLLTGGRRTVLPRQQTLQALIDWSWNLLDDNERQLMMRLSVFAGGWTLAGAQAICGDVLLDEYAVFDLLEQLVNKSLVVVSYPVTDSHPASGEARYGMLESIHEYNRDRLFAAGDGERWRDRHADYYAGFAVDAGPHLLQADMLLWVQRITAELDNLRAVLAWTLEERPDVALRIASSLIYSEVHWLHPSEAVAWLRPAIERARGQLGAEPPVVNMHDYISALVGLVSTLSWIGRRPAVLPLIDEAIALARQHGEERLLAAAIMNKHGGLGRILTGESKQEVQEAITIARRNNFQNELFLLLSTYAASHLAQGRIEEAATLIQEAMELVRRIDNPISSAMIHYGQGFLAQMRGDWAAAREHGLVMLANYEALNAPRSIATGRSFLAHNARYAGELDEAEGYYRQTILN